MLVNNRLKQTGRGRSGGGPERLRRRSLAVALDATRTECH